MGETTNKPGDTTADDYLKQSDVNAQQGIASDKAADATTPSFVLVVDEAATTCTDSASTSGSGGASGSFLVTEGKDVLKLWLKFDTDVNDYSENQNNGTLSGSAVYAVGAKPRTAGALTFDGSTNYVTVANESQFDFERTQPFSVAFWVKYSAQNNKIIIGKATGSIGAAGWQIWLQTGFLNVSLTNTDATNQARVKCADTSIADGAWHLVVVTFSGSSTVAGIKVYFDNVSQTLTTVNNNLSATMLNNIAVVVGALPAGTSAFTGSLDDVRIYNIELSASQASNLYTNNVSIYDPAAVADFSDAA